MKELVETKDAGMYWHFDQAETIESRNFSRKAMDLLDDVGTKNMSRQAGAAIQFIVPTGYLRRREIELEQQLKDAGLDTLDTLYLITDASKIKMEEQFHGDLVSEGEWEESENVRATISVPKTVKDSIDAATQEFEGYHSKQKARFVSNCIIAHNASVFDSILERIEFKEQLLKEVQDERIERKNRVFELFEEGEVFSELHEELYERKAPETLAEEFEQIDPEDDVTMTMDEEPDDWTQLPKTQSVRTGAFIALLRGFEQSMMQDDLPEDQIGFEQDLIMSHIEMRYGDYTNLDYVWENHIKQHLTQGDDGLWVVNEDNASFDFETEEERKSEIVRGIKKAKGVQSQRRQLSTAFQRNTSTDVVVTNIADIRSAQEECTVDELRDTRDYLLDGLDDNIVQQMSKDINLNA